MDDKNLILLTLDLDIPRLWENDLVQNFPKATFTIKQANPLGDDSFSGLLKIDGVNFSSVNKFLEENHPLVSMDYFYPISGIYHFLAPDKILPNVLKNSRGVLSWPVNLMEKYKRIKLIMRDGEVEKIMVPLEKKNIDVKKFSKIKIDFNLKEILTPKQKEILTPSLRHGYYEFPKRISLNELSRKIGVSPSTLCVHLQKIESKIMGSNGVDFFL